MKAIGLVLLTLLLAGGFAILDRTTDDQPFAVERAVHGKPNAGVGWLEVAVVDRPSLDRAVVRAIWQRGSNAQNCRLVIHPGQGAFLMEGEAELELDPEADSGEVTWLIDFRTDRDLDAVVRLCAQTQRGAHSCEAYVPLARAP